MYLELGGLLGVERGDALAACSGLEAAGAAVLAERDGLTEHLPPHGREQGPVRMKLCGALSW